MKDMNINDTKKIDEEKVAASIASLPAQIADIMKQAQKLKLPPAYKKINRVVVNGMGGSNLGARIVASVFKDEAKVPILIEPGYQVPAYIDRNTLYIISSYSGNTEEPVGTFVEAKKRGAKIIGITESGSKNRLAEIMEKEGVPGLIFNPTQNPSGQPRLGLGYAIFALLALLSRAGVIKINPLEIARIILALEKNNFRLDLTAADWKNPAKQVAKKIYGKEIVLVGAEFLEGNLHAWRNQFCETAKNFADYLVLPDLNHYAMEGLAHPASNKKNSIFIFVESDLYRPRIKKRSQLTREIVRKNKIEAIELKLKSKTKLAAAAELLQLGSWITFYLAMLNQVNPNSIQWVDWFKKKLA
ncbi:MAG: SIS domain-containing protein [Patescibacteria group bacterium]|nr:SIS domain-containing protein [Patescibacteria group bacterium]